MNVKDTTGIQASVQVRRETGTAKAPEGGTAAATVQEHATEAALTVDAARRLAGQQRATRLKEIEAAVRSGNYVPNAAQIASQILASAELDARLRVLLSIP
ncbi:MAG: hypothetical protein HY904_05975 [Deltaproteobacteria bacterium]|nr:hypothetical protein [Deltaproteobacteria bacterium]